MTPHRPFVLPRPAAFLPRPAAFLPCPAALMPRWVAILPRLLVALPFTLGMVVPIVFRRTYPAAAFAAVIAVGALQVLLLRRPIGAEASGGSLPRGGGEVLPVA